MKKTIFVVLTFALFATQNIKASHIAGAEITYNCLGSNQYIINLKLYWDCTNGFDPGNPQSIQLISSCGDSLALSLNQSNTGGTDVSQLCHSATSSCNGGTNPGYKVNIYSDTITLTPCNSWTMSWTNCCRNAAITNLQNPSSAGMYAQAILNSITAPCNSSPNFTSPPLPILCVNQSFCYNFGIAEPDGDSLNYSLINAMDAGGITLVYNSGYTATMPIPGIAINQYTGQISFTPTIVGNYVVVVKVSEYNHNGALIGSVMQDIQFGVFNCTNQTVACTDGSISNLTGSATQTGSYTLEMCQGASFTFKATFTDPNAGDSLSLFSNILNALPGSIIATTGINPLTAIISWTAPGGSSNTNKSFSLTVKDNYCPKPGQKTFVYVIKILPRTLGGTDKIICGNQTTTLHGTGGNNFIWSVLSGPAMVVGTNFSCNSCANPVASPISTTTYQVVSNISGTCVNKDTVTVTVAPGFSFIATHSTDTLCLQQLVQFGVTCYPPATYSYLWSPSTFLNNVTIANPEASNTAAGTCNYNVKITSPFGCVKKDTITVTTLPIIRTRAGRDTTVCSSQSTPLHATGGNSFSWSVLSGPAMVVGVNFSCNPCANPIASPTAATTYQVRSNLNGTCINKDTVVVTVVPSFTNTIIQSATTACLSQAPIQLNATSSPSGVYSYLWDTTSTLNNYTIPSPLAIINSPGTHVYSVKVTSSFGCVKKDSVAITVAPSYPPDPIAYCSNTTICAGDTLQLGVTFGNSSPAICGTNPIGCSAAFVAIVGTGTTANTATTWPAPYGNWYTSAKHQFLFKASELIAAGITGGKIDQIDFNVTQINGSTTYHQYTINMGCTSVTALSNWVGGLSNVYSPKNHTITTGWNTHPFDNAFVWDGISNVIIEICFNEGPPNPNYTQSCISPNTLTSFVSCLYKYGDTSPLCPDLGTPQTTSNRPNVKFHYCGSAPDSSRYTYSWLPAQGIFHPHVQTTGAVTTGQTNYYVLVTDTVSGCSTNSLPVPVNVIPSPSTPIISQNGSVLISSSAISNQWYLNNTIIAGATSQNYSPTQNGYYSVIVTGSNGCSAASAAFNYTLIGIEPILVSGDPQSAITIYPNPNRGSFFLQSNILSASLKITVMNVLGEKIYIDQITNNKGRLNIDLPVDTAGSVPHGIYFVQVLMDGIEYNKKISVQ